MNLRPLHDRVIVKRLDQETKTASGLIIPDAAAEKPDQGEVLAIGNGKVQDNGQVRALEVKVGDRVLFARDDQYEVEVQGSSYTVLRERELHAVATERTEHGTGLYL